MRAIVIASIMLLGCSLTAQNVLHYKFDGGCGSEVINFASGAGNALLSTTLVGGPDAARVTGMFGEALTGSNATVGNTRIDTGWAPFSASGDFSYSMWLRNRPGNPTAIGFGYLLGATGGSFRIFTGGSGRLFLSGVPSSATNVLDLTTLLNAGWVHAACTYDSTNLQATWYINGVADPAVTVLPAALTGTDFTIGARDSSGGNASPLETDEFILSDGVWSAGEIAALALQPPAADGNYTSGIANQCGSGNVVLSTAGGAPSSGNLSYSIDALSTQPSLVLLLAGLSRCSFDGSIPLPLDGTPILPLLNGCWILTDAPVLITGVSAGAPAAFPFPIPATVPSSVSVYAQAIALDLATGATSMSEGLAISTGF